MTERTEEHTNETQTTKEQTTPRKPNATMIKKIKGKTFVTEIFFDLNSKDTFQDKLIKVIHLEQNK
ncbi:Transposon-encoded protein TnpW [Tissierella praeacuta DSM 18095]|uniref:Transposon-encoded protein TnpW n=1 Tax=Tissierella praeacuta DSM 18095 TaxID=1123404 RepID=A0A1M4ZMR7_9FIRM|nr:transposase [Tissierella praeacuta]TCU64841.1 transposon-encoded protein TnpW [Tissierella praeacuta]SHF19097.1 Transposon-encoded protein TnpW [Tissierella praeacuta DSM 18095]SUP02276.1 Uncharacterised protein [Tissierella praeacuta]